MLQTLRSLFHNVRSVLLSHRASLIVSCLLIADLALSVFLQVSGRRLTFAPYLRRTAMSLGELLSGLLMISYFLWRGLRRTPNRTTFAGTLWQLVCVFCGIVLLLMLLQALLSPMWILSVIFLPLR